MKNQFISRVINFFAFNLLFFALYLNFIHQDAKAGSISQNITGNSKPLMISPKNGASENKTIVNKTADLTVAVNSNASPRSLN